MEPEKLEELARLAMAAPSAMNRRPWEIVIINEPEGMDALRRVIRFGRYIAPAAVVVCGNRLRGLPAGAGDFWVQDCAAAMENLLVGATALGLGTVWLGVYPLRSSMEKLSAELGLPAHVVPMGAAYVGYPAEEKAPRTQYQPEWVHWQRMGPARPARSPHPRDEIVIRTAMDVIRSRRSVRKYTGEPVGDEQLRGLLEAGFCAPTAHNLRPWRFIVVRDAAALEAIREFHPHAAMLPRAGRAIVVCGDRERQPEEGYLILDCAAAIENMLLAAHAMELGAVWLGVYPRPERIEGLQRLLGIPYAILPVGIVAVGHAAEDKEASGRYDAQSVHWDRW